MPPKLIGADTGELQPQRPSTGAAYDALLRPGSTPTWTAKSKRDFQYRDAKKKMQNNRVEPLKDKLDWSVTKFIQFFK